MARIDQVPPCLTGYENPYLRVPQGQKATERGLSGTNRLRKNSLDEGHGFHGTPGQVSRAVGYAIGEGFSPWGTVFQ